MVALVHHLYAKFPIFQDGPIFSSMLVSDRIDEFELATAERSETGVGVKGLFTSRRIPVGNNPALSIHNNTVLNRATVAGTQDIDLQALFVISNNPAHLGTLA